MHINRTGFGWAVVSLKLAEVELEQVIFARNSSMHFKARLK